MAHERIIECDLTGGHTHPVNDFYFWHKPSVFETRRLDRCLEKLLALAWIRVIVLLHVLQHLFCDIPLFHILSAQFTRVFV
jgi:hypothetical protein